MLTYKFLNTFIDDIFAFVIKMPTLYRIGCLRDDVIFFIYLYQRYIYAIDPTRVNEFGFSAEMLEEKNKNPTAGDQNGSLNQQEAPKSIKGAGASPTKTKDSGGSSPTKTKDSGGSSAAKSPKTKASKTKAKKDQ